MTIAVQETVVIADCCSAESKLFNVGSDWGLLLLLL